jgi:putative FmdB family regulatory protein
MIYEYICTKCKHEWEAEQKITAKVIKKCPKCKKLSAKRQISKTSFQLLGGSWAKEGYGNK